MKKIILILLVIFSLVIALPSCDNEIESHPEFDWLNSLCNRNYSSYTINIVTKSPNGDKIEELYDIDITDGVKNVAYKVERFSTFDTQNGQIVIPGDYINVTEGSFTTDNESEYALPSFDFSYNSLQSDIIIANTLRAKIISLDKFIGIDMNATDAKVVAEYTAISVKNVAISFVTESGNTVTVTYIFE